MKFKLLIVLFSLVPLFATASEFKQATTIKNNGKTYVVESKCEAKIPLVIASVSLTNKYHVEGTITVKKGSPSLIMWSRIKGNYYFSKLPTLQSISSTESMDFSIPFNPLKKTVDQIKLEIILPNGGKVKIQNLKIKLN